MRLGHRPRLDGLRGIAVTLVVVSHAVHRFARLGQVGVGLFFVLSAFLITTLLEEERDETSGLSIRHFYIRRALRLTPALGAFLVVYVGLVVVGVFSTSLGRAAVGAAIAGTYSGDFFQLLHNGRLVGPGLVHTWSLGVEEQFYLVWPALLVATRSRFGDRQWVWRALVAAAVAVAIRSLIFSAVGGRSGGLLFTPLAWADAFLLGAVFAVLRRSGSQVARAKLPSWLPLLAWAPAVGLLIEAHGSPQYGAGDYVIGLTLLALGSTLLVAIAVGAPSGRDWLGWRPLVYLGRISYGVYLWHYLLLYFWRDLFPSAPTALGVTLAIGLSVGVAAVSHRFVERPFLRLKDRERTSEGRLQDGVPTGQAGLSYLDIGDRDQIH